MDYFRALLEFFSDVVRDEVLMRQRLWAGEGIQMVIELRAVVNEMREK